MAATSENDDDPRVIGQAMLDLAARLPEGYQPDGEMQANMYVSYDAGDERWEVEFWPIDAARNFCMSDPSLEVVITKALRLDREAARDV